MLLLGAALIVVFTVASVVGLTLHRRTLVRQLEEQAIGVAGTLFQATWAAMLENDQESLRQITNNVTQGQNILALRVISADGEIRHSNHPEEIGARAEFTQPVCQHCHADGAPQIPASVLEGTQTYDLATVENAVGVAVPVLNAPECWQAACHVHDESQSVLGVLEVEVATAQMEAILDEQKTHYMWLGAATFLLVTIIPGLLTWRLVHRPFHRILEGTRRLGAGELDTRLHRNYPAELGELAASFNTMANSLEKAQDELRRWGQRLEVRVERKTRELERAQQHMVFTEKMVSLGKLAAVVAHEINNPLGGILVSIKLLRKRLPRLVQSEDDRQNVDETLAMMERETARSGDIVRNLLLFSREKQLAVDECDVIEILERSLKLVGHKTELQNVEIHRDFDDTLPAIECDPNQIEQGMLALLLNAIDAMPDGGNLTVRAHAREGRLRVEVEDEGVGIPPEIHEKIFDPFFTTKSEGQGTGLGLSVLYGIARRHGGEVDFRSEVGRGTCFWIDLPIEAGVEENGEVDVLNLGDGDG